MDRRRQPRIVTNLPAAIETRSEATHVRFENLSEGGAFVTVTSPDAIPPVGTGIQFKLRLPSGFWICGTATVRWTRSESSPGYGIEFGSLHEHDRAFLEEHVAKGCRGEHGTGEMTTKFRIDAKGRALLIAIAGPLDESESQSFASTLKRQRTCLPQRGARIFVNATRFAPCPRASVEELARAFEGLAQLPDLIGVVAEGNSLATVQLRRLVHDSGLAEKLLCYPNEEDASKAWSSLWKHDSLVSQLQEPARSASPSGLAKSRPPTVPAKNKRRSPA